VEPAAETTVATTQEVSTTLSLSASISGLGSRRTAFCSGFIPLWYQ
jgi:hypothetical protein